MGRVVIVGASFSALGRRLPGVLRVPELALRQRIKSLLFAAEQLELVQTLVGIGRIGSVCIGAGWLGVRRALGAGFAGSLAAAQPSKETQGDASSIRAPSRGAIR